MFYIVAVIPRWNMLCPFTTLETRRQPELKCLVQLFLGLLPGKHRSAIGHFFARLWKQSQKSLRNLTQSSFFLVSKVATEVCRAAANFGLPIHLTDLPKQTLNKRQKRKQFQFTNLIRSSLDSIHQTDILLSQDISLFLYEIS